MHLRTLLSLTTALATTTTSAASIPHHPHDASHRIPTVRESATMARRILSLTPIGTLSTIFPSSSSSSSAADPAPLSHTPSSVANTPIGLMEYIADCHHASPDIGNPTILAMSLATPFKNAAAGSNISLAVRWHPPHTDAPNAAASRPRFSLTGYLEKIPEDALESQRVEQCYTKAHPDVFWLPGSGVHESEWVRLVVKEVYWFGGFGDRAYIGWIPVETWRGVSREEIEGIRLPGEVDETGSTGLMGWFRNWAGELRRRR